MCSEINCNSFLQVSLKLICGLCVAFICLTPARGQTPEATPRKYLTVPANLVVENVPPVPGDFPARLDRYLSGYGVPLAGWDKTKRELWLKDYGDKGWQIARLAGPLAKPEFLFKLPPQFYDLYWQPGGKYIAYTADQDGNEKFQLHLFDPDTGTSTQLTDGQSRNVEPVWSQDGQQLAFGSTPAGRAGMDLYTVAPFQPKPYRLRRFATSDNNPLEAFGWSPDGKQVVYLEYLANRSNNKLWLADLTSGTNILLTPKAESEQTVFDDPQFSADGHGLYCLTNQSSEFRRLAYFNLKTRRFTYLSTAIKWDVEEYKMAPDGQTIAFVTNEGGISNLYLLQVGTGKITRTKWHEIGLIAPQINEPAAHLHWHNNSVDLAFDFVSPQTPNDIYSLNTKTGEFTKWANSVDAGLPLKEFTKPQLIHWPSFDQRTITGFLYAPPARFTGPRPVVIDLHGGPEEQSRPGFNGEIEYYLQELGVAKIYPNVRGSTGYGTTFMSLDDGLKRTDAVKDVGALLDWIATQPNLDAQRVMVLGSSYGGYLSLSVATAYGARLRAVAVAASPTNLVTYLENTDGWRRAQRRREYGDERLPQVRAYLDKIAPRTNAPRLKIPLLLMQGQNDPRVKLSEATAMVTAVRQNKTPVWYLLGKNEGHGFSDPKNFFYAIYATTLFMQEFLIK